MIKPLFTAGVISSVLCISAFGGGSDPSSSSDTVLIEIDGAKITLGEFEHKQPNALFQARNTFYEAERKAADAFVDEYLLDKQAQKEHLTVAQLLEKHVDGNLPQDPSEEALRVFYEGLGAKVNQPYEAVRGQILDRLHQIRKDKMKDAYVKSLREAAKVAVMLAPPRAPVSLKDTPVRGEINAPVMIVEFADYECPYCQQIKPVLDKVSAEYPGKVAFAYKDAPLPMHAHAQKAAEAAHCAGTQGKYWEFHDALFQNKQLDIPQLKDTARNLKLDAEAFDKCLDSGATADLVQTQLKEAESYKIQGTPSFLINGRFFEGVLTYEQLHATIDEELKGSAARPVDTARR
jgi:protein-disulfide isomerase